MLLLLLLTAYPRRDCRLGVFIVDLGHQISTHQKQSNNVAAYGCEIELQEESSATKERMMAGKTAFGHEFVCAI